MKSNKIVCAAALCAVLTLAAPAHANDCWDGDQVAAARVRDLQSKLMVATMRCHAMGIEIADAYNGFVRANRTRLESINGTLKTRFASAFGKDGQNRYDRFTTSLANAYGADKTDADVCGVMTAAAREAEGMAGDLVRLLDLADRIGIAPNLPGGQCGVTMAALPKAEVAAPIQAVLHVAATASEPAAPVAAPAVTLTALAGPTANK